VKHVRAHHSALAFFGMLACTARPAEAPPPPAAHMAAPLAAHGSAPPAAPAPTSPVASAIGSPHPLVLEAASATKSWAVVCQARKDSDADGRVQVTVRAQGELAGDTLASYLVLGGGEGERIDELAAYDPMGRWLVVRTAERLRLIDAATGGTTELAGADARPDRASYREHRTVSFDALGKRLAWLRVEKARKRVVVRELLTGVEHEVDPGSGEVWRLELTADGNWVLLQMIADDTNKNGRLDWPVPPGNNHWRCQGPLRRFDTWLGRGDAVALAVAPASGGSARAMPGLAVPLGRDFVVRDAMGRLLLQRGGESGAFGGVLASEQCGARVFDSDTSRGLLLLACVAAAPAGRPELMLVGPGFRQLLGVRVAPFSHDRDPGLPRRLVPVYSGRDTLLVDFDTRRVATLRPDDRVIELDGALALIRRSSSLFIYDAAAGAEQALPGSVNANAEPITDAGAPGIAALAPLVVHLGRRSVLGQYAGRALAVASDGAVLIAQGGDATEERLAVGPLVWQPPAPLTASAPLSAASKSP
jgi:hypothetical protein